MAKIILDIKNVSQWYGDNKVLHDVNLQIAQGQFVGLVGPSGCGKSTLLRAIQGVDPPKAGQVLVGGEEVLGPNRNIGIVYQNYILYDWLTAEGNVAMPLRGDQTTLFDRVFRPWFWWPLKKKHLAEARELLVRVGLEKSLAHLPSELSGGMKQRVAIAQALINKPKLLLLDEPFGALDESTRRKLQKMLLILYAENVAAMKIGLDPPYTVVFITHELGEAFYCADRVVGMSKNWKDESGLLGQNHGATKIYDKSAPVYKPDDPSNYDAFADLMKELRAVVFDPNNIHQARDEHVTFWSDLAEGIGTGVSYIKNGVE